MSPVFPKKNFCEAQRDGADCPGMQSGLAEGGFYLNYVPLWGRWRESSICPDAIAGTLEYSELTIQNQVVRDRYRAPDSLSPSALGIFLPRALSLSTSYWFLAPHCVPITLCFC